jgi:predicted NAD-dependent protein-ADP-ribosyltransferase YbiA (DUF1768 family)
MKKIDEKIISAEVNAKTLAKILGLTDKRIGQLASENRIPAANAVGQYPLGATVERYCENLRSRAEAGTITAAKRRKMEASAAISEMELATKRNELVELSAVEQIWTARKLAIREIVLRSPLSKDSQDEILNELADARATDYLKP